MKKRRIFLAAALSIISLTISACDMLPDNLFSFPTKRNSESSSQRVRPSRTGSSSSEHVHKYSEQWEYNSTSHWHKAICGHDLKSDIGQHTYYSAVVKQPTCTTLGEQVKICTVCDYRVTTYLPTVEHNWHEYSRVEPTCTSSGMSKKYCTQCGESIEEYLEPLPHNFEELSYQEPTCLEYGSRVLQCKDCGEVYNYPIPKLDHVWANTSEYYSGEGIEGGQGFSMDYCSNCGSKKVLIKAIEGNINGGLKQSDATNYGYVKLASNGNSISYRINYPNNAYGKLYLHAIYDQNPSSSLSNFSYYYQGSSSYDGFNFAVDINGSRVDLRDAGMQNYADFFVYNDKTEEVPGLSNNGFTNANYCLLGDAYLSQGLNEITYTRAGSYNLLFDYLVFIVIDSDHVHNISSNWEFDDNTHWHRCSDINCPIPNTKFNSDTHVFDSYYRASEPTCQNMGVDIYTCSICGYSRYVYLPKTDHKLTSVGAFEKLDNSVSLEEYMCSDCGNYFLQWSAMEYDKSSSSYIEENVSYVRFQSNMVENANGVPQRGAHLVYQIYSPVTLTDVGLAFNIYQSNGNSIFEPVNNNLGYVYDDYGNLVLANQRYGLIVNGSECRLNYDGVKSESNSNCWYDWPTSFTLQEGLNTIDIYCLEGSYRARMYDFRITGIPRITPNHVHTPNSYYDCDDECHYHSCTNGDGAKFDIEAHTFGDYITVTAPTCEEYGQMYRVCSICGYERYETLYPTGHNWSEGVVIKAATHDEPGTMYYECLTCGATKTEAIPAGHNYGATSYVNPVYSDDIGYSKRNCLDDGATELDFTVYNCTISGSSSHAGNNFVRLRGAGSSISFKFSFDSYATAKLYTKSVAPSYNSYLDRTYTYGTVGTNGCNFEVIFNGSSVDMSESKNITYQDFFKNGVRDPSLSESYSPVANCLIGSIELIPGQNELIYTLTGSAGLYISDFILVIE